MKNICLVLLGIGMVSSALGADALKYTCHVSRTEPTRPYTRDCGMATLSIEDGDVEEFKACGVSVASGSASAAKGKVMTVYLGTNASKIFSKDSLRDMTSLAFYPESAPKDFMLSLYPGSLRYGKYGYNMECTSATE